MNVYTEQEYLEIWDWLPEAAREDLAFIQTEKYDGMNRPHESLLSHHLAEARHGRWQATHDGKEVYRMGQPNIVGASDPPAAPDSSIPQPLAELAEARERIRELETALKTATDFIEVCRNSTHMPPSLYMMLTGVSLMIGSTLKGGEKKP